MSKHFFDYDDGDFAYTVSDNMAIDSGQYDDAHGRQYGYGYGQRRTSLYLVMG